MIIGSTLIHDGTGTAQYLTSSFARGGQAAVFSVDVTHMGGTPTLVVTVEHKNFDDATWVAIAVFTNITGTGVATKDATSLKEEIRLAFTYSAGDVNNFMHVVMAAPGWRPNN